MGSNPTCLGYSLDKHAHFGEKSGPYPLASQILKWATYVRINPVPHKKTGTWVLSAFHVRMLLHKAGLMSTRAPPKTRFCPASRPWYAQSQDIPRHITLFYRYPASAMSHSQPGSCQHEEEDELQDSTRDQLLKMSVNYLTFLTLAVTVGRELLS